MIETELKEKHQHLKDVEELTLQMDYILPHEFLFLLKNSVDRHTQILKQQAPELEIQKVAIDEWNKSDVNGIRLDYLYKLDTDVWESWYTIC